MASSIERTVRTSQAVLRGAVRPQTLPTQLREVGSGMVAAALYPFGWLDRGPGGPLRARSVGGPTQVRTPVLLVHGYLSNKSNWYFLERDLRSAGFGEVHAMNYRSRHAELGSLGADCVERAREVMASTGTDRIHLVGHSLGGLVIRQAVQLGGLDEAASVVTVATPHGGVDLARLAAFTGRNNEIGRQLKPGSSFLRSLWESSTPRPATRFVAYYSNLDLLVAGRRAKILEADLAPTNLLVKDHGHLSIVLSRQLTASVVEQLSVAEVRTRPAVAVA